MQQQYFVTKEPYACIDHKCTECKPILGNRILTEQWEIDKYTDVFGPFDNYEDAIQKSMEIELDTNQGICRVFISSPQKIGFQNYVGQVKTIYVDPNNLG